MRSLQLFSDARALFGTYPCLRQPAVLSLPKNTKHIPGQDGRINGSATIKIRLIVVDFAVKSFRPACPHVACVFGLHPIRSPAQV